MVRMLGRSLLFRVVDCAIRVEVLLLLHLLMRVGRMSEVRSLSLSKYSTGQVMCSVISLAPKQGRHPRLMLGLLLDAMNHGVIIFS